MCDMRKYENNIPITIFTPTYNRESLIVKLYNSLVLQTKKSFEWVVVDDGGTDNTDKLFDKLKLNDNGFNIIYYKKENGGKCSAINEGVKLANGRWFLIVDSDDYLLEDAIEIILDCCSQIENKQEFGAICCLKCYENRKCIGGEVDYDTIDSDFLSYRTKLHYNGDRSEVIRTEVMKEFPFPVFKGEKFLSEATVWNRMAKKYKCRYYNKKICVCEYQADGLSGNSSKLFNNSPKGSMLFYKENFQNSHTLKGKIISSQLYWRFYFSTSIKDYPGLKPIFSMYPFLIFYPLYLIIRYFDHKRRNRLLEKLNN